MIDLTRAYTYGSFNAELYFAAVFNTISSKLNLRFSSTKDQSSKETLAQIISLMDWEAFEMEMISKKWSTQDYKDADPEEDHADNCIFKSKEKNLLILVGFLARSIYIEFLYDATESDTEAWILSTANRLRNELGRLPTPSFKVLAQGMDDFYTQKVDIKDFGHLDIDALYNDDFKAIHNIIIDAIQQTKSGLILLHGKPGTGKTTYIKSLLSNFKDHSFIFIQNDLVPELLKPTFVSFLMKNKDCIFIIEDAEKTVVSRETESSSVVSTILQLTDGLFSDYLNIKVICSFNTGLDKIDKALLRKGRMIARYEFKELNADKSDQLLESLGHAPQHKALSLAEIYKAEEKDFSDVERQTVGFR